MTRLAVLWDVGGPINTEETHEANVDAGIRAAFEHIGVRIDDATYEAACEAAVASYASDAYSAIIWRLANQDAVVARQVRGAFIDSQPDELPFQMRSGIPELLHDLYSNGVKLGLVANQPASTLSVLERHGIAKYFDYRQMSGSTGYRKPDVRIYLGACAALGVLPGQCIMVGDRIDNDIAPAQALGMATILFRTGRHRNQQPRNIDEVPDAIVEDVGHLRRELLSRLHVAS